MRDGTDFYAISLQYGYRSADLSVVYPVARGTGLLLAMLGAVYFLHISYATLRHPPQ